MITSKHFMVSTGCLVVAGYFSTSLAQEFTAGEPLGANNQSGDFVEMSSNVTVYGSFHADGELYVRSGEKSDPRYEQGE